MADHTNASGLPQRAGPGDVAIMAFEHAPLPLCVIGGSPLQFAAANARFRAVVGRECAPGTSFHEVTDAVLAPRLTAALAQVAATGSGCTLPQVLFGARADTRSGASMPGLFDILLEPVPPHGSDWAILAAVDLTSRMAERLAAALRLDDQATDLSAAQQSLAAESVERAHTAVERDALRRQLAVVEENERGRLARELHDQLGQQLTALALGLAAVAGTLPDESPSAERVASLVRLTASLSADVRYLTLELRPPELDDVGLASAVATYVGQWAQRVGIAADFQVTGTSGTPPVESGSAIFRIVQEALTNVARHAEAKQVSVILEIADDRVRVIVEDDGVGFDVGRRRAEARAERRHGLAGMQERTLLLGGVLHVESSPGAGTTVFVTLPVDTMPS